VHTYTNVCNKVVRNTSDAQQTVHCQITAYNPSYPYSAHTIPQPSTAYDSTYTWPQRLHVSYKEI